MKFRILIVFIFFLLTGKAFSQNVLDGVYVKENIVTR
jgi:hypothetical protein